MKIPSIMHLAASLERNETVQFHALSKDLMPCLSLTSVKPSSSLGCNSQMQSWYQ